MECIETPRSRSMSKRVRHLVTLVLASAALSIPVAATAASAQTSHGGRQAYGQWHGHDGGRGGGASSDSARLG